MAESCCVSAATRSTLASPLALTSAASASLTHTSLALPETSSHFSLAQRSRQGSTRQSSIAQSSAWTSSLLALGNETRAICAAIALAGNRRPTDSGVGLSGGLVGAYPIPGLSSFL